MYTYGITGTSIDEFGDVVVTNPQDDQVLQYNSATGKWENATASGGALPQALGTGDNPSFAGVTADAVRVGVTAAGEIDTTAGNLTIDSFTGQTTVDDDLEVTGTLVVTGHNSRIHGLEIAVGHTLSFEGSTNDGNETTLTVVDPTADRTITLPNATGTVVLDADSINVLSDVSVSSASIGQVLEHDGTNFVNKTVFAHTGLQAPVNTRRYGPIGGITTAVAGINVGSCSVIRFKSACSITALSIYLNATYSAATTYDYRLGIYADSNGAPGALLVDAGTLSIATGATAGFKTITLGTAQSVAANTPVWLICAASHSGTVPNLTHQAGNFQPYSDYGLSGSTHTQAACLAYLTGPATALPDPFVLASPETQPAGVAVYATVSVP